MVNAKVLSGIYLFKEFDPKEMALVAPVCLEKSVTAGQELFATGQEATSFFVIVMGSIKIFSNLKTGDSANITQLGSGSHFGELAFFDKGKRSATAQAVESTQLIEIPYDALTNLLAKNPTMAVKFYQSCARFLASRLRNTTEDLATLKEAKLRF